MASPSALTAIDAPGWRGALPRTPTTVARANRVPPPNHRDSSGSRSRIADLPLAIFPLRGPRDDGGELFERGKTVTRHEHVNVRKGRGHTRSQRREPRPPRAGVGPDHPVR